MNYSYINIYLFIQITILHSIFDDKSCFAVFFHESTQTCNDMNHMVSNLKGCVFTALKTFILLKRISTGGYVTIEIYEKMGLNKT